jgi:hypothetical protein
LEYLPIARAGTSHNVAHLRLECYAAGSYEQRTFNHDTVVACADADPSTTPQPAPTQTAQAQTNHFALAARLPDISVRRARSTRFAKILSACSLPLLFTRPSFMSSLGPELYAVSLALTVTSVSSRTGRRSCLWDARGGGPITLRNGPLCTVDLDFPRHAYDLVSREVLTAREVEHVKAPNSLDTASIAGELRQ